MKFSHIFKIFSVCIIAASISLSPAFAYADSDDREEKYERKIEKAEKKLGKAMEKSEDKIEKAREKIRKIEERFGKNNDDNEEGEDDEENENADNNKKCRLPFGHLIAPGFIKNLGSANLNKLLDDDCLIPFGIAKKLFQSNGDTDKPATTTPDTTAPIISSIMANTGTTTAEIKWQTNERADSKIYYATSSGFDLNATTTKKSSDNDRVFSHKINLSNLNASTTYFALVTSKDRKGNTATSTKFSFVTKGATTTPPDTVPPTISSVATSTGTSTASISWQTNEPATSKIYYSTTSPVDTNATSTIFVESLSLVVNHILNLFDLMASTTYHFFVESKDNSGNTATSTESSFTTSSP